MQMTVDQMLALIGKQAIEIHLLTEQLTASRQALIGASKDKRREVGGGNGEVDIPQTVSERM